MEEKLKAPDGPSADSDMRLLEQCQELQSSVQEKEDVIAQLEQQLEEQVKQLHRSAGVVSRREKKIKHLCLFSL